MIFSDFIKKFGTERDCKAYLVENQLLSCKRQCRSKLYVRSNGKICCGKCKCTVSPDSNSILFNSHVSLDIWFYILYQFWSSKNGMTGVKVIKQTGLSSQAAWTILNRIRNRLLPFVNDFSVPLNGVVEMDEVYIQYKGTPRGKYKKRGRGAPHKMEVVGMVSRKTKEVRFFTDIKKLNEIVEKLKTACDTPNTFLMTDGYLMYRRIKQMIELYRHEQVNHKQKEWTRGYVYTQTIENVWRHIRRLLRTHMRTSKQHLVSYLAEAIYKWNNNETFEIFLAKS